MVDALDNPAFTGTLRASGHSTTEINLIKDVARHAVEQALLSLVIVLETVDDNAITTTMAAFVLLREKANAHALQIGKAVAEKHGVRWPPEGC